MDELYQLKEMLCKELEEYGRKGELSGGTLEIVDKLAHALKNLDRIIMTKEEEEGYSQRGGSYAGGGNQGGQGGGGQSYRGGNSYARGRGRNARRDSMGRYSREGGNRYSRDGGYSREGGYSYHGDEMIEQLEELMEDAPNNQIRQEMQKLIKKVEEQM